MPNLITTVDQATQAGKYDAQYGAGAYKNTPGAPTGAAPTNYQAPALPGGVAVPGFNVPANTSITGKDLAVASPYNLPQSNTAPTTQNLGLLSNGVAANAATTASTPPTQQTPKDDLGAYLKTLTSDISGQATNINQINTDAGIADKKAKAQELSTQLDTLDKSFRDQVKTIRETFGGTTGGAADAVARAQDQYENTRANLALSYKVANEDYQGAAEIAQSKVQALKDQNAQELQLYQVTFNSLQHDLTDSEQLQAESNNRIKEGANKTTEDAYATALQAGTDSKASAGYFNAIDAAKSQGAAAIMKVQAQYGVQSLDSKYKVAQISKMYQDIADAKAKNIPAGSLVPGDKNFKIAQDLAYGDLTFTQFNSLYGRAVTNANLKTAIYEKAQELNPNFSPAQFELGYKIAANPKIRQQISALDNVQAVIPTLIGHSEDAARSNSPLLNKFIIKGGVQIGDRRYSDFQAAQIAFADELSGALGFGSATDMSRGMGFDLTRTDLSPAQFQSAIKNIVVPFIAQKRSSIVNQMGVYGADINSLSSGGSGGILKSPDGTQQVNLSDLTPAQVAEAKSAGWK